MNAYFILESVLSAYQYCFILLTVCEEGIFIPMLYKRETESQSS